MLTVDEARARDVCRVCGKPATGALVLHYGREYAHPACLDALPAGAAPTDELVRRARDVADRLRAADAVTDADVIDEVAARFMTAVRLERERWEAVRKVYGEGR